MTAGQGRAPEYVVSLTRWARPLDEEVGALAPLLGGPLHEVRRRLAGAVPVVLASTSEPRGAADLRAALQARGHGAVICDVSRVTSSRQMTSPRDFELTDRAFIAHEPGKGAAEMPYAEIGGLVWARRVVTSVERKVVVGRAFNAPAALLTGGLITSKRTMKKVQTESSETEAIVYVFRSTGEGHCLLAEGSLRYAGLGAGIAPTRAQNFRLVVDALRERAAHAVFDARLATSPPRTGAGSPVPAVDATDLAAHLVLIARLQGQI